MITALAVFLAMATQAQVVPAESPPRLRPGDRVTSRIEDGDAIVETDFLLDAQLDTPAVGRTFGIEVAEAGLCHVEMRSDFFDTYLVLRDEQGRILAEDDDGLIGTQSRITFEARPGTRWRLQACALHGLRGAFEVSLRRGAPAALDPRHRLDAGIDELRRIVDTRTRVLGPDDPSVATSLNELANLLTDKGDYAGARPLFECALAIRDRVLAPDHADVARTLADLASLLLTQGSYAEARPLIDRALAIHAATRGAESPEAAADLNNLGLLLKSEGDFAGARPIFERSRDIFAAALGPDEPDVATVLDNLSLVLQAAGDDVTGRQLVERSLAIRERVLGAEHPDVARSLDNLGNLLARQEDFAGARPLLTRGLAIVEKALGDEHPSTARSLNSLGSLLQAQGDYSGARPLIERALAIREQALGEGHPDVAASLGNMSGLLQIQGDYPGARARFERALEIDERVLGPDHPGVASALASLALLAQDEGNYTESRALGERSLAIREKAFGLQHPEVASSLNSLGILLYTQGDFAGARPLFERSLEIREASPGPRHLEVAQSLGNLALLLDAQDDAAGARPLFERSLEIYERVLGPAHPEVARTLHNLARLLRIQGDYAAARPLFERSLAIWERALGPDHPTVATSLSNLGLVLQAQGDLAGARPLFERALAIFEESLGPDHPVATVTLNRLGMLLADMGDSEAATRLVARGDAARRHFLAEFTRRASEADVHDYLATLRWQMDLVQSPTTFAGSATAACESILWWKGQALRAARTGRDALRDKLGDVGRGVADRLQDVVAELSRYSTDVARDGRSADAALDRARLTALIDERGRLERELYALTSELAPEAPSWARLRDALPDDAALVDLLAHHVYETAHRGGPTAVAPGHWSDSRVTAWITRRAATEPVRVDLGPMEAIERAIRTDLLHVTGGRGAAIGSRLDVGADLRRLIWDPLAPQLEGIATVIVSPDGVLGTVPFEILRDDRGRYLVEDRSFVYLTDPTDIVRMSKEPATEGTLLAIGGVDYWRADAPVARSDEVPGAIGTTAAPAPFRSSGSLPRGGWAADWASLDATETEARGIAARHAAVFPGSHDLVLTGAAATEEQLKALLPRYSDLHIATHGYFNPDGLPSLDEAARRHVDLGRDNGGGAEDSFTDVARRLEGCNPGLLSGLVCAGVNGSLPSARDDGYLTAEEVGWLDLSGVDLVVLSACDTGLGRPQSGEGLIGLRRAFLLAGARTVISSLWAVPDQETSELMELFYRNLWQQKLGKHAALRAAQLEMIAHNREAFAGDARPVTWGAFVLDGDWR